MNSTPEMWFEDFHEGRTFSFKGRTVEKDEIIDFASKYDPQPFHLDEEFAARTPYGGLIASGWHTAAMVMRILCDNLFANSSSLGSPGIDELRWKKPVRPGDELRVEMEVTSARESESRPEMGLIYAEYKVFNQNDELVMTFGGTGMYRKRGSQ